MTTTTPDLFEVYRDAYMDIRARYQHPDDPILYRGWTYCETLPPRGWDRDTYSAYFAEVMRLSGWYDAARTYAAIRRKTAQDRATYDAACDEYQVAGQDLQFVGDPAPAIF